MEKLWQKIRHNQSIVFSGILVLAVVLWAYGCEPTVRSIQNPNTRLNRAEFQSEVDAYVAQAASKFKRLSQHEELRRKVFAIAIQYIQGGAINPVAVAITCGNILGLGAVIDNRRKDVLIKSQKSDNEKLRLAIHNNEPVSKIPAANDN